jgi:DNA polymerase-3 subunit beta
MRFNTKVADLLQALKVAKTSIASRNAIACLMNFKIELDGNELKVSGSDLDSDSKCMIDVNGEEDGGILVDSDKLFRMINAQPKTQIVTLATDDDILNVFTSDGFKATIAGYAVSDYPDDLEGEFDTELA